MNGYVYLIHDAGRGLHKVGSTWQLAVRVKQLAASAVGEFTLLGFITCPFYRRVETGLKKLWASKCIEGEWFSLSDQDVEFFKCMASPSSGPIDGTPSKDGRPRQYEPIYVGKAIRKRAVGVEPCRLIETRGRPRKEQGK